MSRPTLVTPARSKAGRTAACPQPAAPQQRAPRGRGVLLALGLPRGAAPLRERIEALVDPTDPGAQRSTPPRPDADRVLVEVREFASLARSGAYLARDRRVSPKERTRWRHTFRRLAGEAQEALDGDDFEAAAAALAVLIDLACATRDTDFFRSEDPVEAARFVVSDAAARLWGTLRQRRGFDAFAERAAVQLLRWESASGWTRRGEGEAPARESSLARVLRGLLTAPESWGSFAGHYLTALDGVSPSTRGRRRRAENLAEWHGQLLEHLIGSEQEELLDRLVEHPALAGPKLSMLREQLAGRRCAHER